MTVKLMLAGLASIAWVAYAHAQDVVIDGEAVIVEQAPMDESVIIRENAPGPRVYGWMMRPADCGTFRYWNGVRCADARDEPPVPR
jgi:hypothetical protein